MWVAISNNVDIAEMYVLDRHLKQSTEVKAFLSTATTDIIDFNLAEDRCCLVYRRYNLVGVMFSVIHVEGDGSILDVSHRYASDIDILYNTATTSAALEA